MSDFLSLLRPVNKILCETDVMKKLYAALFLSVLCVFISGVNAGFFDDIKGLLGQSDDQGSANIPGHSILSYQEIALGLKEALGRGAQSAVKNLGKTDGFLSNPNVKITIPDKLRKVEKGLRAIGKGELADQFIVGMNRAAEEAVPMAADVFKDAITGMSIQDAMGILQGGENAGTNYLRKTSSESLRENFRPIVSQAIDEVDATSSYQAFLGNTSALSGLLGGKSSLDLTDYVTDKALDGVFQLIAEEERKIRENPAARTSDLLKKVFGAVD